MNRPSAVMGLVGVVAVVGTVAYAARHADFDGRGPALNVAPPTERVRVEVLNASGVAGQAREATLHLRDRGFDVVQYGNAERFDRESSAVIDRVGRPEFARAVAAALGVLEVVSDPDPNLFVDVTVLLGSEWRGPAAEFGADTLPERDPWDPRGWIGR